jgi:hypothetical protein
MRQPASHPTRPRSAAAILAAAALAAASTAAPATAGAATGALGPLALGVSLDFLWSPDPDNDTQVYLHVSNMAFQPPRDQIRAVYPRLRAPESDFPVLCFIAGEARVSLVAVWDLRAKGLSWAQVMVRLGVPPERIFVEMPRDPGPPYGKAYGHWKKRGKERYVVSDDDVFYWVNIRAMSRYFGVRPEEVVNWRESGRTWKTVAAGEFRTKKGKGRDDKGPHMDKAGVGDERHDDPPGHSKGKGKGR